LIKAIAVDKDGTFFKSDNTFDEAYFNKIFKSMMDRDMKFIIASGNQYAQLRSFFPDKDHQIAYIAENGAVTYQNNKLEEIGRASCRERAKTCGKSCGQYGHKR